MAAICSTALYITMVYTFYACYPFTVDMNNGNDMSVSTKIGEATAYAVFFPFPFELSFPLFASLFCVEKSINSELQKKKKSNLSNILCSLFGALSSGFL